jgi:hypothetical protein
LRPDLQYLKQAGANIAADFAYFWFIDRQHRRDNNSQVGIPLLAAGDFVTYQAIQWIHKWVAQVRRSPGWHPAQLIEPGQGFLPGVGQYTSHYLTCHGIPLFTHSL